jgi:hypothetical protein
MTCGIIFMKCCVNIVIPLRVGWLDSIHIHRALLSLWPAFETPTIIEDDAK